MPNTKILVVGLMKSGTTLLMKAFKNAGVFIDENNCGGNLEHYLVQSTNRLIYQNANLDWYGLESVEAWFQRYVTEKQELPIDDQIFYLTTLVRERFNRRTPWAIKDPKASLTLPFWLNIFPDVKVVLCIRDPNSIVASYRDMYLKHQQANNHIIANHYKFGRQEEVLEKWMLYNRFVLNFLDDATIVFLEDWKDDYNKLTDKIYRRTDIDVCKSGAQVHNSKRHRQLEQTCASDKYWQYYEELRGQYYG